MWRSKSGVWCEESEGAECLEGTGAPGQWGREREERGEKGEPVGLVRVRSVQRWLRMFEMSGRDIRSVVPGYAQRGPRGMKLSPEVEEVLPVAVERVSVRRERAPVTHVIDEVRAMITEKNALRLPGEAVVEMPSRMSVYRSIERVDPEEVDTARFGKWIGK